MEVVIVSIQEFYSLSSFMRRTIFGTWYSIRHFTCPGLEPFQIKGYWILGISPKKSITVGLKAKARRNELEDRFRLLNWQTLEKRRDFLSLVQCYKLVFGIDSLPFSDFFELTKFNRTRANRDHKLYAKVAILKAPNILSLYGSLVRGITCLKMLYTQDRWLYFATDKSGCQ